MQKNNSWDNALNTIFSPIGWDRPYFDIVYNSDSDVIKSEETIRTGLGLAT